MAKKIQDVIKENMDIFQAMMESEQHISDPLAVIQQYSKCSLYRMHMNEEDSDYLTCAAIAIEEQIPWKVPPKQLPPDVS